jgi:hypothetical protein
MFSAFYQPALWLADFNLNSGTGENLPVHGVIALLFWSSTVMQTTRTSPTLGAAI